MAAAPVTVTPNYRWLERAAKEISAELHKEDVSDAEVLGVLMKHAPKRGGKAPDSWVGRMCEAWERRFGKGSASAIAKLIGRFVKPLIEIHGEAAILIAWNRYLAEEHRPWPTAFATCFGRYLTAVKAAGAVQAPAVDMWDLPAEPAAEAAWEQAKGFLKTYLPDHNFQTWFRPTRGLATRSVRGCSVLEVAVPTESFADQLRKVYGARVCQAVQAAGYRGVDFKVPS